MESPNHRSIRLIFFGFAGAFVLIAFAPVLDDLFNFNAALLRAHNWSSREFKELVSFVVYMTVLALVFLICAIVLKDAGVTRLSVMASVNAILLGGACLDAKSLLLAFPLSLTFVGLIVEIVRAMRQPKRKLA